MLKFSNPYFLRLDFVYRIEGFIGPEALVERLRTTISDNEAFLVAARADREERSFNQALRLEQDEAYLESLRADQEKEEKKRRERLLEEERLKEIREIELAEERKKEVTSLECNHSIRILVLHIFVGNDPEETRSG